MFMAVHMDIRGQFWAYVSHFGRGVAHSNPRVYRQSYALSYSNIPDIRDPPFSPLVRYRYDVVVT